MSIHDRLPQIEVAIDDEKVVLVMRVLDQPSEEDRIKLIDFSKQHNFTFYLQPKGPDSIEPLEDAVELSYTLPDYSLELFFLPTDFTQVNSEINRKMVKQALDLLAPGEEDGVLDLFCGIGNFTLPIATRARSVTGIEGDLGLVKRAEANAQRNQLENVDFFVANLYESLDSAAWTKRQYAKALIDPPRSGAQEILDLLPRLGTERIVYVSCYPGTLARDAGILVNKLGYTLVAAGVMDMFPHTAHVESIALFEKR